jgi:azurin
MNTLLALAEFPASDEIGAQLYEATLKTENQEDAWIRKALFAAAITHTTGFLAASKKPGTTSQESGLSHRMATALSQELYELPRRGVLPFPVDVSHKEIIVKASVAKRDQELEGMIMAQGGKNNGYALFIEKGKLNMVVQQNGKTYKAVSTQPLPEKLEVVSRLAKNGEITLEVNGKQVAKARAPSWFDQPLTSAIRIGFDFENEDKIGNYEDNFRLRGNLQSALLELRSEEALMTLAAGTGSGNQQGQQQASAATTITIKVVPDMMKYDIESFTVQAGQEVIIEFENTDGMQHNMLIVQQGALETVGAAADAMLRDPNAAQKNYVPEIPEVLHATKLLNPEEVVTLRFVAPSAPGDYPFVCTFPGHWRMMNGIMKVSSAENL